MSNSDFNVQRSAFDVQRSPSPHAPISGESPWLGLASYTEDTRAYFFGRDDEVAELARRVQRKLLTVLFGQSGLGKTSILRAGLVPKLRPEGFCPIYVRLDHSPFAPPAAEQIKQAVVRASEGLGTWSRPGSAREGESLWEFFHHRDDVLREHDPEWRGFSRDVPSTDGARIAAEAAPTQEPETGRVLTPLLIFDQFEEIFTLAQTDDAGRARAQMFLRELADLVENRAPTAIEDDEAAADRYDFARADYRVLIALREDYLAHLERLRDLMPSITQNRVGLARMAGGPALEAVLRPGAGLVNDDVARQIVRFVSGANDLTTAEVEPSLLSLVCRELNELRLAQGRPEISADLLEGSRDTILNEFYERSLADQPEAVRRFIEDELLTDSGFRESLADERALKVCTDAGAPQALTVLVDRRLLRIEERLDVRRVELTHDVLCSVVKSRRDTRRDREAREAAERRAAETEAREAATKRALWRARMIAASCAVMMVVAIAGAIFGFVSLRHAHQANARAETARAQAEGLVSYMMEDLEPALEQYGRLSLLNDLATQAVRYFESLPPDLRDVDTDRKHASALSSLAFVMDDRGDGEGAEAAMRQNLVLRERVAAAAPDSAVDQARLITARNTQTVYYARAQTTPEEKQASFEASIATLSALRRDHPDNREILGLLAQIRWRYGWHRQNALGQPALALAQFLEAQQGIDELLRHDPDDRTYRREKARILQVLSTAYDQLLEHEKALQLARESLEYAEDALKQDPGNKVFMEQAAGAAQNLSYRASTTDRTLSIEAERIARERFRTLSELDPESRYFRSNHVWSHMMEAYGLEALGQTTAAREAFRRFRLAIEEYPDALQERTFDRTRQGVVRLDEARMAAEMGDVSAARALLIEAQTHFTRSFPDASRDDPGYRKTHVLWQLDVITLVARLGDWPGVEQRTRAALNDIAAGLAESPGDPELLLRRARARTDLGQALLHRGHVDAAVATLTAAAADWRDTPPVPQGVVWDRDGEALTTTVRWAEALIAAGETGPARAILDDVLPLAEKRLAAQPDDWVRCDTLARLMIQLAAALDPADAAGGTRRSRLLDQAAKLLEGAAPDARASVTGKETLAELAALRAAASR